MNPHDLVTEFQGDIVSTLPRKDFKRSGFPTLCFFPLGNTTGRFFCTRRLKLLGFARGACVARRRSFCMLCGAPGDDGPAPELVATGSASSAWLRIS